MPVQKYQPGKIEKKWQKAWADGEIFQAKAFPKAKKLYVLDMFPYPSGEGLHVGHPEGYTALDIYARFLRMKGFEVLHPMGWDAFGLPAENYAIKTGARPEETTKKNIKNFKRQIQSLGFSYDWTREVNTTDPKYYKWTQWIFLKLFEAGLAYEAFAPINWCPKDKTGLANEEVVNGKCERCGTQVVKKNIRQWLVKITDEKYIERLLNDLDKLDWPENIKLLQRNWIGRSEGALVSFKLSAKSQEQEKNKPKAQSPKPLAIQIFTTRPDTLFGVTYMVLSPEHPLVDEITIPDQKKAVEKYKHDAAKKSDLDRTDLAKEKTGVFTGAYAINLVNNKKIPIWIADYVLASYGTGAIMAVPAHDERDYEFAKKFNLPVKCVIYPEAVAVGYSGHDDILKLQEDERKKILIGGKPYTFHGPLINSNWLDDLRSDIDKEVIIKKLEEKSIARKSVNYKLRDWVFSRQRYWGEPIPIVHCEKCGNVAVSEKDLPLELPKVKKYEPTGTGESPLASIAKWVNTKCPRCGGPAKRETNTMPQWAGSNWYWLRYCDPHNDKQLADPEKLKAWLPVDLYVGGAEHAVLHLLYARFIYKFLFDIGAVPKECGDEPFTKLKNQGLILAQDGQKMSKSRGNVVNPDEVIKEFGADAMRMYEMFMGPFEDVKPWSTKGIVGIKRFLDRVWEMVNSVISDRHAMQTQSNPDALRKLHQLIQKITKDIENFRFNTAISSFMEYSNYLRIRGNISRIELTVLLQLTHPFAPHITSELWELMQENNKSQKVQAWETKWPIPDKNYLQNDTVLLPIQINGKIRDQIEMPVEATEEDVQQAVLDPSRSKVQKWISGKDLKMFRYVKGKIVSIVV